VFAEFPFVRLVEVAHRGAGESVQEFGLQFF
jgi:hypothetical protein